MENTHQLKPRRGEELQRTDRPVENAQGWNRMDNGLQENAHQIKPRHGEDLLRTDRPV
eukprot:c47898_g1_i1 orf=174-347(+)